MEDSGQTKVVNKGIAGGKGNTREMPGSPNARTPIEHEARKWLIRMDGDAPLTDADKAALREWMNRSPLHRSELARLARFWNQANILTELVGNLESERRASGLRRAVSWKVTILMVA